MATKTIKRKYVKYYVSITNISTGEISYYEKTTKNEDYSPFIEYEEGSDWTKIDELPNTELFLLKFTTTTITAKIENDSTEDEAEENISTEEQTLEINYYYNYYEAEVDLDRYIKVICTDCKYCHIIEKFRKKYNCSYLAHTFTDYITGEVRNGECKDFNSNGECRYFSPNELPTEDFEDNKSADIVDKDEADSNDETNSNTDINNETSTAETENVTTTENQSLTETQ